MAKSAEIFVGQLRIWVGHNEYDGSHRKIVDIYNTQKVLPRGHKLTYEDPWCAGTVSAASVYLGYTDIIPPECSCTKMIELFKKLDSWVENDAYIPKPGDIIFYDWDDSGKGENVGQPEHVGVVEELSGSTITVIEGNIKNAVGRRKIAVNGRYIRGYGVPKYDEETAADEYIPTVKEWQDAAIADGYKFPKYGADGVWGNECESVAKKALVKKRLRYTNKNLTRIVQKVVGVEADGLCGPVTVSAIKAYQKTCGLDADGVVGINTWKKMLL